MSPELIEVGRFGGMSSVLQMATSAISSPEGSAIIDQVTLRGFTDTAFYRNGINDSLGQMPLRSMANVRRIEVLKGPYGALYGPGTSGGSINFYTKRPQSASENSVTLGLSSYSDFRLDLDPTGKLVGSDKFLYRFIASREQANNFRDFVKRDHLFLAPAMSWRPAASLRVDAALEYIENNPLLDPGIVTTGDNEQIPRERFLREADSGGSLVKAFTFELSSSYQLTSDWQADLSVHGQSTLLKGEEAEPSELQEIPGSRLLLRERSLRSKRGKALAAQGEVSGIRRFWRGEHHLLAGLEATAVDEDIRILASDSDDDPFAIDIYAPVYGQPMPQVARQRDFKEERRQVSFYARDLWRLSGGGGRCWHCGATISINPVPTRLPPPCSARPRTE